MDNAKLTFWCNNDFGSEDEPEVRLLKEAIGERRLLMFAEDDESDAAHNALRTAHVAFGYPSPAAALRSENLRWIQLNSAGYTTYDHDEIKQQLVERRIVLTNSSSVYDEPCAQHLLAMITGLARQLPAALDSQRSDKAWEMIRLRASSPLLNEQTVVMLGFGAIARRLVELLRPLHMNLMAVRRSVTGNEPIHVVDMSQVDELLPLADHVVNILPANEQTKNFLNATRLGLVEAWRDRLQHWSRRYAQSGCAQKRTRLRQVGRGLSRCHASGTVASRSSACGQRPTVTSRLTVAVVTQMRKNVRSNIS